MAEQVFDQVKAIIVDKLGVDESKVTMEARFREDLEADSLDLVELIMEFEEKFGGEISDEEAQKITTVGEAVNYLKAQMKQQPGSERVAAERDCDDDGDATGRSHFRWKPKDEGPTTKILRPSAFLIS
jgi:acyl carrier protein